MEAFGDMQAGGIAGLAAALLAGLAFSFSPVAFASIPAVVAYVTRARAAKDAMLMGGAFVAGMVLTHVALGIVAAWGGAWVESLLGRRWGLALGFALILLGLMWTGWLRVPMPWLSLRGQRSATLGGAFVLGILFTFGICPACSPGLWVGLGASAAIGHVGYGALLMLVFALGRALPLLAGAVSMGWLKSLEPIGRWRRSVEVLGGLGLVATGLYLLNEYLLLV